MFFSLGYEKIPREEASAAALFPAVSKFFSSSPYSLTGAHVSAACIYEVLPTFSRSLHFFVGYLLQG